MRDHFLRQLRRIRRIGGLFAVVLTAWRDVRRFDSTRPEVGIRTRYLHAWAQKALRAMDIDVAVVGSTPPNDGLIVSNHLSYLDILVYSSLVPSTFVSKSEVAGWPIIGTFALFSGTIFVRRAQRGNSVSANSQIKACLAAGVPVVLFPEGTTTDGSEVLRFHSSMLEAAIETDALTTPCAIRYELLDGDPALEVCWWGNMTLAPHFLSLMGKREVKVTVCFGESIQPMANRKELAAAAKDKVVEFHRMLATATAGSLPSSRHSRRC